MAPHWLEPLATASVVGSIACAVIILLDITIRRGQPMAIMNVVWPITALYLGPLGLWAYWRLGRPGPEGKHHGHEGPKRPLWQAAIVGTTHCGAGCVVGDLIGEWAMFLTGFRLFGSMLLTAFVVDFALAYAFGILFQYFAIAPMRKLGVIDGLVAAIKADTISLIAFEVGMFGVMALNQMVLFDHPPHPTTMTYWFLMQLAMIAGFLTSYPANWLLIKLGIKEAM
jgi:hypothetical protein